jgi:hypothetical protein
VSSRHGRGLLFSMSWLVFYSADVSIRHLVSFEVPTHFALSTTMFRGGDFSGNGVRSPAAGSFAWRKSSRRGWAAASDVRKLAPAVSSYCGGFCLFCHVSTLAEWEAPSSTGPCGLFSNPKKGGPWILENVVVVLKG